MTVEVEIAPPPRARLRPPPPPPPLSSKLSVLSSSWNSPEVRYMDHSDSQYCAAETSFSSRSSSVSLYDARTCRASLRCLSIVANVDSSLPSRPRNFMFLRRLTSGWPAGASAIAATRCVGGSIPLLVYLGPTPMPADPTPP